MKSSFPKHIIFTGPESSGKTTHALWLSKHLQIPYFEEFAIEYLEKTKGEYCYADVVQIARLQEKKRKTCTHPTVIFDTDLMVIKVWLEFKYRMCPKWIDDALKARKKDAIFLLCKPDFQWTDAPFREAAEQSIREELFGSYEFFLKTFEMEYLVLEGALENRKQLLLNTFNY